MVNGLLLISSPVYFWSSFNAETSNFWCFWGHERCQFCKLAWPSNSKKNIVPLFFFLFVGHVKHKNIVVTLFKVILKGDTYSLWIAIIGPNFQLGYTLNAPICTRGKWIVCWDLYLLALSLIVYKDMMS